MANTECTLYDVRDGAAWITLNRPEKRNALSAVLVNEVYEHLQAALADDTVRCIVLTGAGQGFCSGADLKSPPGSMIAGEQSISFPILLKAILDSSKPVLTAVNGPAYAGGLGLVGASDIVVTAEEAKFSFSEVRIGVIPAVISVVCLRKLGNHHGMRLFLTGEAFTGQQAVDYGLAHRAVPAVDLEAAVKEEIDMIKLGGPIAIAEAKKLVRQVPELSVDDGFKLTEEWSVRMFLSEEGTEGITAFREKRKPKWAQE